MRLLGVSPSGQSTITVESSLIPTTISRQSSDQLRARQEKELQMTHRRLTNRLMMETRASLPIAAHRETQARAKTTRIRRS